MTPVRNLRAAGWILAAVLLSGAAPETRPAAPSAAASARPNLLLITVEGLRPDRLSCYRAPGAVSTPNMDGLAAEGRLFEQVLTPSPSSLPALSGLLTGQTQFQHRVWDDAYRNRLSPDAFTLAERLKKEGYKTAAFVATSRLAAERGLDQGFDLYQDGTTPPATGVWKLVQRPGSKLVPAAKSWLEGVGGDPFFLWLHFIETMVPALPAQNGSVAAAEAASYARRVRQIDARVGDLITVLKERALYENTVVVLTAAHGLALGEHGESRAGVFLYDGTVRVPLLIKTLPGDPKKGSRTGDLAGLVDLFPTLERLLKVPPTPGLPGRDLLAQAPSASPAYYSVALMGREVFGWSPQELVASGTRRLISGAAVELYDVASDPRQEKDLSAGAAVHVRAMQDLRKRLSGGLPLPPPHFLPDRGLSADISKRLVAMGYVAPTLENARARRLPDPRLRISALRLLEISNLAVEMEGFPALAQVGDPLLKEDPDGLFTLINVARLRMAQEEAGDAGGEGIAAARALLKTAQKRYPLEAETFHILGHLAFPGKEFSDAEVFLKAAWELSPRFPSEVSYDLACVYTLQGRKEAAVAELQKAIRLGFRDSAHIASDPDLEGLREDPAYKRLIQDEFPPASGR